MKRWILCMLATMTVHVYADDVAYKYLVMTDTSGKATYLSVDGLSLKTADGVLTATNANGSRSFELTQLASMKFVESADVSTGIDTTSNAIEEGPVEVFSLAGVYMGNFDSLSLLKSRLSNGVYIVKKNGSSKKITVRK